MIRPKLLLRAASVLGLFYCAAHMMGMPWIPANGPAEAPLIELMKTVRFDALGSSRTYWEFYQGFGVIVGVALLLLSVQLWQFAALGFAARPLVASALAFFLADAYIAWRSFFWPPVLLALAIAVCLVAALATMRRSD